MKKYPVLVKHLDKISLDESYKSEQQEKAEELRGHLIDPNFLILMKAQIDVLSIGATQSLYYQTRGTSQIQELERQNMFRNNLNELKLMKGSNLKGFLKECKCTDDEDHLEQYLDGNVDIIPSCGDLDTYEMSNYRVYNGIVLTDQASEFSILSSYWPDYVRTLLNNQEKFFLKNKVTLELFDIFSVHKWSKRMPTTEPRNVANLGRILQV